MVEINVCESKTVSEEDGMSKDELNANSSVLLVAMSRHPSRGSRAARFQNASYVRCVAACLANDSSSPNSTVRNPSGVNV